MKKLYPILFIVSAIVFIKCEKAISWDLDPTFDSIMVVEGGITSEYKSHTISLYYSFNEINGSPDMVSNAIVSVFEGKKEIKFEEDSINPGLYHSPRFAASLGNIYLLSINYNNNFYHAEAELIPVSPFNPIAIQKDEETDSLYSVIPEFENVNNTSEQAKWEIVVDWTGISDYKTRNDTSFAREYFYTLNTLDISEVFKPVKETVFFPANSKIIQKKYSVSDQYATYLRSVLFETEWSGSFFDAEHANLPTNIKGDRATGFFWVSSVISDTIVAYPFKK
jgi:hypothetical protein